MVVPRDVWLAAMGAHGGNEIVIAWIEAGGDVNDLDVGGGTLLSRTCQSERARLPFAFPLARYLLERGAHLDGGTGNHRVRKFHNVCVTGSADFVSLLLNAGADPNAFYSHSGETWLLPPLFHVLDYSHFTSSVPMVYTFSVLRVLLRAGAALDFDFDGEHLTVEGKLRQLFDLYPEDHAEISEGIALATAVRAAGSWAQYALLPHKRVLALRSLRARGRAFATLSTPVGLVQLLSPRFPTELSWRVLEYWRETN
mmetsp:Transcript_28363/g.84920  ORF Transcript_28363/g.84920 Transcript_28363/m.84920 type:complete len:255 (-) Transcript_28363:12-776(-)